MFYALLIRIAILICRFPWLIIRVVEVSLFETRQIANIKKRKKNLNTKYIKLNKTYLYTICWNVMENLPLFPIRKTLSQKLFLSFSYNLSAKSAIFKFLAKRHQRFFQSPLQKFKPLWSILLFSALVFCFFWPDLYVRPNVRVYRLFSIWLLITEKSQKWNTSKECLEKYQ